VVGVQIPPGLPVYNVPLSKKRGDEDRGKIHSQFLEQREVVRTMFEKFKQFLKEFRVEMKKVSWPSRKDVIASTWVVVIVVVFVSFYLGVADLVFSKLLRLILS
jgi:preprotein translocase subunit SecE